MNTAVMQGVGWDLLVRQGLAAIVDELCMGRTVYLIESEVLLGETLLLKIRNRLLEDLRNEKISMSTYEDCLSRLFLRQDVPTAKLILQDSLLIHLSFAWSLSNLTR